MLTAKNQDGHTVFIGKYHKKEDLLQIRNEPFFCPVCNEKVIVKLGVQRVSHFAHIQLSSTCAEYEKESNYHMQGKLQLYHWLKLHASQVELEHYLPEIKQRPDLLFQFQGKTYCLEYQCSSISEELFQKRTQGYIKSGIIPIWVLGACKIQRRNPNLISMSKFQTLFVKRDHTSTWYLSAYCSSLKTFITISHLQPLSSQMMQCEYHFTPLIQQKIPSWINPAFPNHFHLSSWRQGMKHSKENVIRFQSPKYFLKELYEKQLHLLLMPPYVGIPLRDNFIIETSPFIWQLFLLMDNLLLRSRGGEFSKVHVYKNFKRRIERNHIKIRCINESTDKQLKQLIDDYLYLLGRCQIIKEVSANRFVYKQLILFPSNILEANQWEELFYRNLDKEKIVWN